MQLSVKALDLFPRIKEEQLSRALLALPTVDSLWEQDSYSPANQ